MNSDGVARQLRPVASLKAAQIIGTVLSGVLVPRWMGPDLFGQFMVLFSLIMLWRTACNIGGRYIFGRFVPRYASRGEPDEVRAVLMHVLATRAVIALVGAPLLFWLLGRLLPGASTVTLMAGASTYVLALIAGPMFGVQYGLNRLGRSLVNDPLRHFTFLLLLVVLGGTASLERASLALLLAQLSVLVVGLVLARRLLTLRKSAFDLSSLWEHVRFGAVVYAASLLVRVPWHLGESALALQEVDSVKIGYFGVAVAATGAMAKIIASAATLLIPSSSVHQEAGDLQARDRTLGLALKYLLIMAGLFAFAVVALAPLAIRTLLGETYLGALPSLLILALGVLALPLRTTALAMAVVTGRVRLNMQLGIVAVGVFGLAALLLIPAFEARGAAAALSISILTTAVVGVFQMRGSGVLAEARIGRVTLATLAAGLVVQLGGLSPVAAVLAATLYLALLSALGVIRWHELRSFLTANRKGDRYG
jgi:O-antigen/teichoic acid export membrane protein